VNVTFDEVPAVWLDLFYAMRNRDYVIQMEVNCGSGDRTRCEYNDTFDVAIAEVHPTGLMVRNADVIGLDNPPFCAAFFAWDDIEKVHIY